MLQRSSVHASSSPRTLRVGRAIAFVAVVAATACSTTAPDAAPLKAPPAGSPTSTHPDCGVCSTRVTYAYKTADDHVPSGQQVDQMKQVIEDRMSANHTAGRLTVDGSSIVLTVDQVDTALVDTLGRVPSMSIRPVAATVPASSSPSSASPTSVSPTGEAAIVDAKAVRQSRDPAVQRAALLELSCGSVDPLQGQDDFRLPLVTCATNGSDTYVLEPSAIDGIEIADAEATTSASGPVVDVIFTSAGTDRWAEVTASNLHKQVAFVIDSRVVAAPSIQEAQTASTTQISGVKFTDQSTAALARLLRNSGSELKLTSTATMTVSPTK